MDDLISRQAAIEAVENAKTAQTPDGEIYVAKFNAEMNIQILPSAEPERKWDQLRDTISEMAENGGDGTQEDVCRYLMKYMDELEQED